MKTEIHEAKVCKGEIVALSSSLPNHCSRVSPSISALTGKNYRKIFVIGLNKCGTTSFFRLFDFLGIKAYHGSNKPIQPVIHSFEAFADFHPDLLCVKRAFSFYPDSFFILNTRPLGDWLYSKLIHRKIYADRQETISRAVAKQTEIRRRYNRQLFQFFKEVDRMALVNIGRDGWCKFVANWLGFSYLGGDVFRNKTSKNPVSASQQMLDYKAAVREEIKLQELPTDELFFPGSERLYDRFPYYL